MFEKVLNSYTRWAKSAAWKVTPFVNIVIAIPLMPTMAACYLYMRLDDKVIFSLSVIALVFMVWKTRKIAEGLFFLSVYLIMKKGDYRTELERELTLKMERGSVSGDMAAVLNALAILPFVIIFPIIALGGVLGVCLGFPAIVFQLGKSIFV